MDVVAFIRAFIETPRCAEVYNLGGGRENSVSMLEAFSRVERITGKAMNWSYSEQHRDGNHMCYYSDLSKMKAHYPQWEITVGLDRTFEEIVRDWEDRRSTAMPDGIALRSDRSRSLHSPSKLIV